MQYSPALAQLISSLRRLPGVGQKTAQRMAFHLLEKDRAGATELARALEGAVSAIGQCKRCRMLADAELCPICAAPGRDPAVLCVVEMPADVVAVEQSGSFRGRYFVLLGHLSPLDGVGPEELGVTQFEAILLERAVREVVLATNPTVEGDATAHYLAQLCARHGVNASRIAHGVPVGGELDYLDEGTLTAALRARRGV